MSEVRRGSWAKCEQGFSKELAQGCFLRALDCMGGLFFQRDVLSLSTTREACCCPEKNGTKTSFASGGIGIAKKSETAEAAACLPT